MKTAAALLASLALVPTAHGQYTQWVSAPPPGLPVDAGAFLSEVSEDGSTVVFYSDLDNLVPQDGNGQRDVFAYSLATGQVELVSKDAGGSAVGEVGSFTGGIDVSSDGRYVAYFSRSGLIKPAVETFFRYQAYVYDRQLGSTTLVTSTVNSGTGAIEGGSSNSFGGLWISGDGRFVGFYTTATNLFGGAAAEDFAVADRDPDENGVFDEQAVPPIVLLAAEPRDVGQGLFSENGRFLVLPQNAQGASIGRLVRYDRDSDGNGIFDEAGGTESVVVSVNPDGSVVTAGPGNGWPNTYSLSGNGNYVVFGGAEGYQVRNVAAGTTAVVSGLNGDQLRRTSVSYDGRFVAFPRGVTGSQETEVLRLDRDPDGNGIFDEPGLTEETVVNLSSSGLVTGGIGPDPRPSISDDGRIVSFESRAPLTPEASLDGQVKLFVHETGIGPYLATYCTTTPDSVGCNATLSWTGYASVTSPFPFTMEANAVISQNFGLAFYGFGSAELPFGSGTLCVAPPLNRTSAQFSGGVGAGNCSGSLSYDFNGLIQSGSDSQLVVGQAMYAQFWFRDPGSASGSALTDGLEFTVLP